MALAAVIDASPLIYYARLDRLAFVSLVVGEVGIAPAVYQEAVVEGLRRGHSDAARIEEALRHGTLSVVSLDARERQLAGQLQVDPRLGPGECETIACAGRRGVHAILEDRKARQVAARHDVRTMKSVDILFLGLLRGNIALFEFRRDLRRLSQVTGIDTATLFEYEALAEEIATLVNQAKGGKDSG